MPNLLCTVPKPCCNLVFIKERKCFVVGVKSKSSKTWWNQAKEARNLQVVKSRQQNKPKVNTSRPKPQSVDSQSSQDERLARPADNTQHANVDRKVQLVQRRGCKLLQQKETVKETFHDSDATVIEQSEEEGVSTPNSRGEHAEGPYPAEEASIANGTLDNTAEPPNLTSHELRYNETSRVQGSSHDDTIVAQKERGTAEAEQKKNNNQSTSPKIRTRRTLFQEEEMCDDSDATVCEPNKKNDVCPPLGSHRSTVAEGPAQVSCEDDQSQTEDERESQSLLQPLPMSNIMHDLDNHSPGRKTKDGKKTKWIEVEKKRRS